MLQKIKNKPLGRKQILFLVQFAMLLAIEAVFCFTPLGSLPIGPMVATFAMLPVIVAAILLGTGAGTLMGFFAGLFPRLMVSSIHPAYSLTIENAASSPYTLSVMTVVACIFVPIVLLYQLWAYRLFRGRVTAQDAEEEY